MPVNKLKIARDATQIRSLSLRASFKESKKGGIYE
jgi:hypothetical protein